MDQLTKRKRFMRTTEPGRVVAYNGLAHQLVRASNGMVGRKTDTAERQHIGDTVGPIRQKFPYFRGDSQRRDSGTRHVKCAAL